MKKFGRLNSKETNNRISYLELVIFNIKVNINSNHEKFTASEISNMINYRVNLKKELSHLKRVQMLREERKEKLRKIENAR